jgi:NADPH-dependent 2,4-dienoyl-CoA reductase/sulfur reductase-like enzyme/rhodanese-related sulfurtransferase
MKPKRLLIIGGVAAGTKAASKAKRENPELEVIILTKEEYISYAGCGLPYYLGGVIKEQKELVVRGPEDFKAEQDITVLVRHEAVKIIPEEKQVIAKDLTENREKTFHYDKLIIATGASPVKPPIPGINLKRIFTLRSVSDALTIRALIETKKAKRAVVVGGGFIGLEVAENLVEQGIEVTLVELAEQILPGFDFEMAKIVENYIEEQGVKIHTREKVVEFIPNDRGEVAKVKTTKEELAADFVIFATGVRPNTEIAQEAGIELGIAGTIKVNGNMETNIKDIYAVGDCAENINLITGKPVWYPMGSTANKTGRISGININTDENKDDLRGVLGTTVVKLFNMNAAKTGLSSKAAVDEGYEIETVLVPAHDRAHYYPGYRDIITKLIVDKQTHRILGAQIVGEGVVDKPIDILVTAITFGAKVEDVAKLDLAYAPPFSMAMSSTIVAANVAVNKLTDRVKGISSVELQERLGDEDTVIVDTRTEPEFIIAAIPGAINIPLDQLVSRIDEIPKDKRVVLVCKVGRRAYSAYITMKKLGFQDVAILDGGMAAYPFKVE